MFEFYLIGFWVTGLGSNFTTLFYCRVIIIIGFKYEDPDPKGNRGLDFNIL